jgi:hypothetical protein
VKAPEAKKTENLRSTPGEARRNGNPAANSAYEGEMPLW